MVLRIVRRSALLALVVGASLTFLLASPSSADEGPDPSLINEEDLLSVEPGNQTEAGPPPAWQLPFENGQRWWAGAAHGSNWEALDFGHRGGGNLNNRAVAVADGTVGWINCSNGGRFIKVDHGGGWVTGYYHLTNEQSHLVGRRVTAGTYLGDIAQTLPCGGGSTFPHVHLIFYRDGARFDTDNLSIGGYTAHSDRRQYYGYWTQNSNGARVVTANGGARCCLTSSTTSQPPVEGTNVNPNPGFEQGNGNWKKINLPSNVSHTVYFDRANRPRSGRAFLEANTSRAGGSIGQDTGVVPRAGEFYKATAWVKSTRSTPVSVTAALWALGGNQENSSRTVRVGNVWTPIEFVLPVTRNGHNNLRIELYMNNTGVNYNFDDITVRRYTTRPSAPTVNPFGSFEAVSSPGPKQVKAVGWSIDRSDPTYKLTTHMYIGGRSNTAGAEYHNLGATNQTRQDVANSYPWAGTGHGFDKTVNTNKTGTQEVCVYGIDRGEGVNSLLGCRNVTIQAAVTPPAKPATPTCSTPGAHNRVAAAWAAPASSRPISGYTLQWSVNNSTWTTVYTGSARTADFNNVAAAGYRFRVNASSSAGTSAWSATSSTCTVTAPAVPNTPAAPQCSTSPLQVAWTAPSSDEPISGYDVQQSVDGSWGAVRSVGANTTNLTYSNPSPADYRFRVRAKSSVGSSNWSGASSICRVSPTGGPVVSAVSQTVTETDRNLAVNVEIRLSEPAAANTTIRYTTLEGTAIKNVDFAQRSGLLTFRRGQVSRTARIIVRGDIIPEGDESFQVVLSEPFGLTIGDNATITIKDNDSDQPVDPPTVSVISKEVTETDRNQVVRMTVELSEAVGKTTRVRYRTVDGTATQPADYVRRSGVVTFARGQTSKTVSITVKGDRGMEPTETMVVELYSPTGLTLGSNGILTIKDNDTQALPTVSIESQTINETDRTQVLQMTVRLSSPATGTSRVKYTTVEGTATKNRDYTHRRGTITFTRGQQIKTFNVVIRGDNVVEPTESFTIELSSPTGIALGSPSTATVTIVDDE